MRAIKNKFTVLAVVLSIMLTACQSVSERYMNNLKRFIEGVEKNATSFSEEDWSRADAKLSQFTGEQFDKVKNELSPDDKREVGRLVGRYYKVRLVTTGGQMLDDMKSGLGFLRGLGDGLLEELGTLGFEDPKAE